MVKSLNVDSLPICSGTAEKNDLPMQILDQTRFPIDRQTHLKLQFGSSTRFARKKLFSEKYETNRKHQSKTNNIHLHLNMYYR